MRMHPQKMAACIGGMWLAFTLHAGVLMAHDYSTGQLVIAHPWAPPTLGKQRIGVVYFTLRNQGPDTDRLLAVDLPDGGQASLHNSEMQDGVMRMRPIDAAVIPAGGDLSLQPGGMHVMLNGLPGPLIKGGRLRLILRFEKAGPVEAEAAIEPRMAAPSAPSPHQGH
ncbi:MAG: copper chaperone PCu(A)C [Alphaproteobacteria bacterium]